MHLLKACIFLCETVKAYLSAANMPQMIQLETLHAAVEKGKKKKENTRFYLRSPNDEILISGDGCLEMPDK